MLLLCYETIPSPSKKLRSVEVCKKQLCYKFERRGTE